MDHTYKMPLDAQGKLDIHELAIDLLDGNVGPLAALLSRAYIAGNSHYCTDFDNASQELHDAAYTYGDHIVMGTHTS
jgi:hypothetical protein